MLAELDNSKEVFDNVISKWKDQPALKRMVSTPWYGVENECLLQTKVLGCSIRIKFPKPYAHGEFEFAATILATIESFLGSGLPNHLISLQRKIEIDLRYNTTIQELMRVSRVINNPTNIEITFRDYNSHAIVNEQKCFSDGMNQLLADVISAMFMFSSEMEKIERMIKNDAAFDRSGIIANSIFFGMEVLGKDTFLFPAIIQDYPCLEVLRKEKSSITSNATRELEEIFELPKDVVYGLPPDVNFTKVSNTNIHTFSIVNTPVWNIAGWKGVLFLADMHHEYPPVLSLIFGTERGRTIFEEWQKAIGSYDTQNRIGIRIIKGIDQNHPFWYRVAIGPSSYTFETDDELFIITMPCRLHTMQPNNNANLKMFEEELKRFQHFYLCPSYMPDRTASPKTQESLMIKKRVDSIIIYDACDILMDDYLAVCAIVPTDDPIIPEGKEKSPIVEIMRRKKKMQ